MSRLEVLCDIYDADLQRIKKVYDVGYTCECVPQESIAPEDPHDLKSVRSGAGTLSAAASGQGVADRRAPLNPEVVEDSPVQMNAGPGGECICRSLTTTQYVHTHDGRVVREYVNGVVQRDFLYAGSSRIGVTEKSGSNYNLKYFLADHLGSTRQVIDSSGLVESRLDYYPYGNVRSSLLNYNTKVRYTGKVFDDEEVEQTYYGARYLNGVTNRFNSVDPLQHKYPGWSPYCYALGNPIRNRDVEGKWVESVIDFASFTLSLNDFRRDPSLVNFLYLAADAIPLALPVVPAAVGYVRHGDKLLDLAKGGDALSTSGKAARGSSEASELTGQLHHAISKKIHDALENHPVLAGEYKYRDPQYATRAKDLASHNGYQEWHRNLDDDIVKWLERNDKATPEEFEKFLRDLYEDPDLAARFPQGLPAGTSTPTSPPAAAPDAE